METFVKKQHQKALHFLQYKVYLDDLVNLVEVIKTYDLNNYINFIVLTCIYYYINNNNIILI